MDPLPSPTTTSTATPSISHGHPASSSYLMSIPTRIPWACLGLPPPIWFLHPTPLVHLYGLSPFSPLIHSSLPRSAFANAVIAALILNLKSPPCPTSMDSISHSHHQDWDSWIPFLPNAWLPNHLNATPLASFPTRHARVLVADQATLSLMPLNSDLSASPTILSPRHPNGPLARSGLLSVHWAAKLYFHVPALALVFIPITPPNLMSTQKRGLSPSRSPSLSLVDESIFSMLRAVKSALNRAGGGRTWACLVIPDGSHLDAEWVNECIAFLRRELGLDRQSCLVTSLDANVAELADHIATTIFESVMKYYTKKSTRLALKRSQVPELPSVLTQTAWHIRYDVKLSILASIRGDFTTSFSIALKAYTLLTSKYLSSSSDVVCVNDSISGFLVDPEVLKGNPDVSPLIVFGQRWYEARYLTDILIMIMLRALTLGVTSKNLSPGHLIRTHLNVVLPKLPDGPHSAPSAAWAFYDHSAAFMSLLAHIIPSSDPSYRYFNRLLKSLGHPALFWLSGAHFAILADPVATQSIPTIKLLPSGPVILRSRAMSRKPGLAKVYFTRALLSTTTASSLGSHHLALVANKISQETSIDYIPLATEALFYVLQQFKNSQPGYWNVLSRNVINRLVDLAHQSSAMGSSEYKLHWAKIDLEARVYHLISSPNPSETVINTIPSVAQQLISEHVTVPLHELADVLIHFSPQSTGVGQISELCLDFSPHFKVQPLMNQYLAVIFIKVDPDEYSFILEHETSALSSNKDRPLQWSKHIHVEMQEQRRWVVQFRLNQPIFLRILSADFILNFGAGTATPNAMDNSCTPAQVLEPLPDSETSTKSGKRIDLSIFGQLVFHRPLLPPDSLPLIQPSLLSSRNESVPTLRILSPSWDLMYTVRPLHLPILVDEPSLVQIDLGNANMVPTALPDSAWVIVWIPPGSIPTGIEPGIEFFRALDTESGASAGPDLSQSFLGLFSLPVLALPSLVKMYIRARRSSPAPVMLAVRISDTDPNADGQASHLDTGLTPSTLSPITPTQIPLSSPNDRSLAALLAPISISNPDVPLAPRIITTTSVGRQWDVPVNPNAVSSPALTLPFHPLAAFTASFSVSPIQHIRLSKGAIFAEHRVLLMDVTPTANVPLCISHLELIDTLPPLPNGVNISLLFGPTPVRLEIEASWRVAILVSILMDCPARVLLGRIKVHWRRACSKAPEMCLGAEGLALETVVPLPVILRLPVPIIIETESPPRAVQYLPVHLSFIVHNVSSTILRIQISIEVGTKTATLTGDGGSPSATNVAHIAGDRALSVILMPGHVYRIPSTAIPLLPGSIDIARCVVTVPLDGNCTVPPGLSEPISSPFARVYIVPEGAATTQPQQQLL